MNPGAPAGPIETNEEIAALIETLCATEQRLEELTAGEVDSVSGRDGRTFLLRRAQDQLRHREAANRAATAATLQRQHSELRLLFDLLPAMIWFMDTENRILRVNQRAAEAVGKTVQEIDGRPGLEIYPEQAAASYADDQEVIRSGQPKLGIVELRQDPAGRPFWIETDKVPVRDKAGKVVGLVIIAHDITVRKQTEESLRLLGSALEHSKESILITDADLAAPGPRIVFANPAFEQMTGYTAAEVIGKNPRILQGPLTDKALMARLSQTLREGGVFQGETVNYRKDGTSFDLDWQISPMRDASGKTTHFVAIQRDVTARKQAEDALRMSEKRFKSLFEQAAVGVAQTDAVTGRIVQINQRFCEIIDRTGEEMEKLTFAAITHPDDVARGLEMMEQLRAGTLREFAHEKRYLKKDGSEVWAHVTVSSMWAPGEEPDFFLAVGQEITERKRLEDQFRQAQKMEAIGTLAGGIAHDFNNILAAINGYTELSRMVLKDNPEVYSHLGAVLQATTRATSLVRQILTFSRQQPLERRPIQLLPVLAEALTLLRATIPSTIEFETSLPMDAPVVLADATQVHQILMNLGTNAWHAMRDRPGRLKVTLERCVVDAAQAALIPRLRPGNYARITVSDSGSGMTPATLRRIFEPFFTTKPVGEGTGLGLAVVLGIMDTHDGVVKVSSEPGEGTTFQLYFSAHVSEVALTGAEVRPLIHGHGERILFVDDEELLAEVGQHALVMLGYQVECVTQPLVALERVRADPDRFALVITDQTMPRMTGLMLARELQQIRPDIPIILTSGYPQSLTLQGIEAAGLRLLLLKPFTLQSLSATVHTALSPLPHLRSSQGSRPPH